MKNYWRELSLNPALLFALFIAAGWPSASVGAAMLRESIKTHRIQMKEPLAAKIITDKTVGGEFRRNRKLVAAAPSGLRFEIEITWPIEEVTAAPIIKAEYAAIDRLYSPTQTPYNGDIAQAISGCTKQNGQVHVTALFLGREVDVILGGASARYGFGACSTEAALRGAFLSFWDSEEKQMIQLRIFSRRDKSADPRDSAWILSVLSNFQR